MNKRPYLKFFGLLMLIGSIVFLVIGPLVPRLIDLNTYQQQLVELLEDSLKRKISLGDIRFDWRFGPSFVISDLHVRERDTTDSFLSARKVALRLRLLPLLKRKIVLGNITVEGLQAQLVRNARGTLNIDDLLMERKGGGSDLKIGGIRLRQGSVTWRDLTRKDGQQEILLTGIDLSLDQILPNKKSTFKLAAIMPGPSTSGTLKTSGTVRIPKPDQALANALEVNASVELKRFDFCRLWPYYGSVIPFDRPGGVIDLETTFKGTPRQFASKGVFRLHNGKVVWPTVFHMPVAPKLAQITFDLHRSPTSLDLPSVHIDADGFSLQGSLKLSDLHTKDPYLVAKGITVPFEYKNIRSYVPYGIIEKDAAYFIEHKIKSGTFKLDTGVLEGRFSKLRNFTKGDNAEALYINGSVERAAVQYEPYMPLFNNIKGRLELKGRNFNLHQMHAYFGGSPFTLEGSIAEYSTENVPSEYPFKMEMTPQSAEVAWLARLAGAEKLKFGGNSTLRLEGSGPVNEYRLSGAWQLLQAAYEFPGAIRKPVGMSNDLSFSSILTRRDARLTSLSYSLPPLQLSAMANFRHGSDPPNLQFELQTNQFQLSPQLPVLLTWQQYQPQGITQAHILGNGDPRDFSGMQFSGSIKLGAFSFKPLEQFAAVKDVNGEVAFKGNSLETSSINIRYGKTPLNIKGHVASLKNPEAELFITSSDLRPSDFGLSSEAQNIRNFSADLGIRKGIVTIRNTSGKLTKTVFSAAGTVKTDPVPDIHLRMANSYLAIDELLPFITPKQETDLKPQVKTPSVVKQDTQIKLKAYIFAEAGNFKDLHFTKLATSLTNDNNALRLQSFEASMFGGHLSANGQLEHSTSQPSKWALTLLLDQVKSDELLQSIGINRETSGLMTVKGIVRAQGNSLNELKRTAAGNLSLMIERGVLRRFNSLSKVFSLLNVSQLLTFKLPDMSTEGMPFNQITATVGIKDGILSSQDFFIDSNAMHVSMVGKVDIVKENLDLLIGVQPLQTVDKVISRIPVVGWILTGGDGSIVTTYFEAKGSWADPRVSAIPVKTIATGTLDIFRRVFELPVRLFTDSGEVILGNQKERPKAKEE